MSAETSYDDTGPDIKTLQGTATADSLDLRLPLNQTHEDSSISTETRLEKSQFLCSTPAQWEDLVLLDHSYSSKGNETFVDQKPPECNGYSVLSLGSHPSPPPKKSRRLVHQNQMSAETSNGHLVKPGPNIKTLHGTATDDSLDLPLNQTHKESSISTETHLETFLCSTPAQWEDLVLLDHSYSSKGNEQETSQAPVPAAFKPKRTQTTRKSLSSIPSVTFGPGQKRHVSCPSEVLEAPTLKKMDLLTSSSVSQTVNIKFAHHDHEYGQHRQSTKEKLKAALGLIKHLEAEILGETPRESQFLLQRFQSDPGTIQFYTGFKDYDTLTSAFSVLQPTAQSIGQFDRVRYSDGGHIGDFKACNLSLIDQFFLFLCHVKHAFHKLDLAVRFSLSQSQVTHICVTWTDHLYCVLRSLPIWLHRATIDKLMPSSFSATFPKTRVILKLTKLCVQKSISDTLHSENDKNDKTTMTLKSLVGLSPSGAVTFVSNLYKGNVTDRTITEHCGILKLLDEGDIVMSNDRLLIKDLLSRKNTTLVTLCSSGHDKNHSEIQVGEVNKTPCVREHVKRAFRRVEAYRIFEGTVPLDLAVSVDELWTVCAILTNFMGALF